jgi:hypothetical protein
LKSPLDFVIIDRQIIGKQHTIINIPKSPSLFATMKIAPLALLTVFAAPSSAFGLNGGAKTLAKSATRSLAFHKPTALVQPIDVHGNRLSTVVSSVRCTGGAHTFMLDASDRFRTVSAMAVESIARPPGHSRVVSISKHRLSEVVEAFNFRRFVVSGFPRIQWRNAKTRGYFVASEPGLLQYHPFF